LPSLYLVRQTLTDWTKESLAKGRQLDWMVVCSEDTISDLSRGDPSMRFQEIGVDVTTEVDRIAKFLRKRSPHQDSQWCADFHEIAEFVATGVHHQQVGFIGNESASFCIGAYSNFYINDCH
jgi:hypothetical protein